MNFSNKLKDLASFAENQEELPTSAVVKKLSKSLEANPHDQTIGGVLRVLESMIQNQKFFIRKGQLKDLYKKYYVVGNKFAQAMESVLGDVSYQPEVKSAPEVSQKELNIYHGADEVLANALAHAFDKNTPLKAYSSKMASKATEEVSRELNSWNLPASKISVADGNEKFIIVRADYETTKGMTSFYVPMDVSSGFMQAQVFVGNGGPSELNNVSIKKYITANAGAKLQFTPSNILEVLVKSASQGREISATEMAVIKLNASRSDNTPLLGTPILGQKLAEPVRKDVQIKKMAGFDEFEKQFSTPAGTAAYQFGADKIKIARDVLIRTMNSFGYNSPQINIVSNTHDTVLHAVSLNNKIAFTVPVKISSGKVDLPKVLICKGSILPLENKTIQSLASEDVFDARSAAQASPLFEMNPVQVLEGLKTSLQEGNLDAAEDALNVLAHSGNEKLHAQALNYYMSNLNKKEAAPASKCSKLVKRSSSQSLVCAHTGLPENKVYQDAHGNCRPLYRKGMDETYDVGTFITSKIFGY